MEVIAILIKIKSSMNLNFKETVFNTFSQSAKGFILTRPCRQRRISCCPIAFLLLLVHDLLAATYNKDRDIPYICHFFYTGKIFGE